MARRDPRNLNREVSSSTTELSGKFVLRLDPKTHSKLKKEAQAKGESLNSLCLQKLLGVGISPWQKIVTKVVDHYKPLGILLFGSTARGEATTKSDIDLLIVMPSSVTINRSLYSLWDQEFKDDPKISPQFAHLPDLDAVGGIWLEASIDGEILHDPDGELKTALQSIRVFIAEGIYQRKMSYGHPYWKRQDTNAK
ncbi:MAG: hypothetical protein RJB66_2281 [Pseudomonadota bacterium]|jgi:hypothetical protein